mgnify:FL=1|tara:strand:+ start:1081 stop:1563 length:483 start_codon:yes stop_codon:yes gene_type:complete
MATNRDIKYMACDPGVGGGFCYKDQFGTVKVYNMPKGNDRDNRAALIVDYLTFLRPQNLFIEKVQGYHGRHSTGHTSFVLGENYGTVVGACLAVGTNVIPMTPQSWQKTLGLKREKGMDQAAWKRFLKLQAVDMYKGVGVTLKNADALLIMEAGLIQHGH